MRKDDISRYLKIIRRTGAPIILANGDDEPVVLLPLEDYELLLESGSEEEQMIEEKKNKTLENDDSKKVVDQIEEEEVLLKSDDKLEDEPLLEDEEMTLDQQKSVGFESVASDDMANSMYGDVITPNAMLGQQRSKAFSVDNSRSNEISEIPPRNKDFTVPDDKAQRAYMNKQFVPSRRDLQDIGEDNMGTDDVIERQVKKHLKFAEEQFYLEPLDE